MPGIQLAIESNKNNMVVESWSPVHKGFFDPFHLGWEMSIDFNWENQQPAMAIASGNAVLSASADGSVRAFDLLRYRNFRTFASPDGLCQLLCWESEL